MIIYALASGSGVSGVAVIRVSGDNVKRVVKLLTGKELPPPRVATLRKINNINTSELIDEGIIIWFPGPESYTGEDMAEIHIHGSKPVIEALHNTISQIDNCRLAEPGEFTKLAFQNGKINLLKAESISDLISAEKNNAIADLARKIPHEIKNPLTPMLLSTEFIESQLEDEELINSITSIKRQIFLIQNLVNEFSTYARLPKANITKLNLSEICLVYIDEYKRNYDQIIINYNIEDNLYVHFDHSYLDIIFNNLFKNSIEALNSTTNPAIEITLKLINGNLILTFFDNGPGYDGNIDDLKKPYFSTKKSTGLGLSLIDKIITDNSHKMNITTNSYSGFKIEIIFNDKNISN